MWEPKWAARPGKEQKGDSISLKDGCGGLQRHGLWQGRRATVVARQPGAQSTQRTEILQVQEDASQRQMGRDTCEDVARLEPEKAQAWLMPTAKSYRMYPRAAPGNVGARDESRGTRLWAQFCHHLWLWVDLVTSVSLDFPCFVTRLRQDETRSRTQKDFVRGEASGCDVTTLQPVTSRLLPVLPAQAHVSTPGRSKGHRAGGPPSCWPHRGLPSYPLSPGPTPAENGK